jgi:hypothetical protein
MAPIFLGDFSLLCISKGLVAPGAYAKLATQLFEGIGKGLKSSSCVLL